MFIIVTTADILIMGLSHSVVQSAKVTHRVVNVGHHLRIDCDEVASEIISFATFFLWQCSLSIH